VQKAENAVVFGNRQRPYRGLDVIDVQHSSSDSIRESHGLPALRNPRSTQIVQ
jgi:hypothetical protein